MEHCLEASRKLVSWDVSVLAVPAWAKAPLESSILDTVVGFKLR